MRFAVWMLPSTKVTAEANHRCPEPTDRSHSPAHSCGCLPAIIWVTLPAAPRGFWSADAYFCMISFPQISRSRSGVEQKPPGPTHFRQLDGMRRPVPRRDAIRSQ